MKRAITILQGLLTYEEEAKAKVEIRKAIAELKAYKAALQKLKKEIKEQHTEYKAVNEHRTAYEYGFNSAIVEITENMLQKLKGLEG